MVSSRFWRVSFDEESSVDYKKYKMKNITWREGPEPEADEQFQISDPYSIAWSFAQRKTLWKECEMPHLLPGREHQPAVPVSLSYV